MISSTSRASGYQSLIELLGLSALLIACGTPDISVPTGPHHPEHERPAVPVPTPPPPAKIEVVPLRRNEDCLFLDGHYEPAGGGWRWRRGKWVLPEDGCYYAPPTTTYEQVEGGTTLAYRAGVWLKRGDGNKKCRPAPKCPAPTAKLEEK